MAGRCASQNIVIGNENWETITLISVIIAIFENMLGQVDAELPNLAGILFNELKELNQLSKPCSSTVKSFLLQGISMCFAYNSLNAFGYLENQGQVMEAVDALFSYFPECSRDVELRRPLFGLCAIIKTPQDKLPPMVYMRLPEIMNEIVSLVVKRHG